MLMMTGTLLNVFTTPQGTDREGNKYGGVDKVQLLVERSLRNGEKVMEKHDLSVASKQDYRDRIGETISIQVEPFAMQSGQSVPIRFKTV